MWGRRSSRTWTIALAVLAFVVFSVLPVAYMVGLSFAGPRASTTFAGLLLDSRQRALLSNTAALGIGTALGATLMGVPLGLALARVTLPLKAGLRLALSAPVLLPPYVVGLAWIYLGGGAWTYSLPAAILVLSLVFYPLSMLATEVALRRVEPRLEEAALVVAAPGRVVQHITLPLVAPAVAAAALVVFVLAVSEFGVPGLLRVRVFTTEVFTAFAALYDFGRATVLALPLLVLSTIVAVLAARLVGERLITTRRGSVSATPLAFDEWRRPMWLAAAGLFVTALGVPLIVLVSEARRDVGSFAAVVEGSQQAILNSLMLSALGATAVLAIAVWVGYARARAGYRAGLASDALFVVLFGVPSTVVGVGLIGLWNRPGPLGALYGTDAMFLLGYLARFLPVAALTLAASVRHVAVSQEEAAAVSGAGWLRTMAHIILPQVRLGLLAAWVIVFILAFGELGTSILIAPPGETTLPIRIYTIIANTPPAHVAMLALLQAAVIFCPLGLLGLGIAARGAR